MCDEDAQLRASPGNDDMTPSQENDAGAGGVQSKEEMNRNWYLFTHGATLQLPSLSDHKLHNGTWDACWLVKIPMVYLPQHWSSCMTCFPAIAHTGKKKTPCQPEVSWACTPRRTPKVQRQRGDSNASRGSLTVNFEVCI